MSRFVKTKFYEIRRKYEFYKIILIPSNPKLMETKSTSTAIDIYIHIHIDCIIQDSHIGTSSTLKQDNFYIRSVNLLRFNLLTISSWSKFAVSRLRCFCDFAKLFLPRLISRLGSCLRVLFDATRLSAQ